MKVCDGLHQNAVRVVNDRVKEKCMDQPKSNGAFLSGIFSSMGLAPHLGFLLLLFFGKMQVPLGFLITTYFASILLGEYLFYKKVTQNMSFLDWLKRALNPSPPDGYFFWAYLSEILFDGIFLYLAMRFNWNPLNFFLVLLGCKFLCAPIQVLLSRLYLSKNAGFAVAAFTQVMCLMIGDKSPELFLYMLILKGVLCNGIAVARSQYASEIDDAQDTSA